ncbi:hypothetical protein FH5_03431 [Priestia endophytica]|nr:hypothetical protein FH5_03431 [Priestia endophytica]
MFAAFYFVLLVHTKTRYLFDVYERSLEGGLVWREDQYFRIKQKRK